MNYIKQNHLSLLIILWLLASGIIFSTPSLTMTDVMGAINRSTTTISNPVTFQQGVTIDANANGTSNALTVSGTTTVAASYDGFVVYKQLTVSTTSNTTIFTNTYAPMICYAYSGSIYSDSQSSTLGPSFTASIGYSSGVVPTANVLASTTIATTTDTITSLTATAFVLPSGYSLIAGFGDANGAVSSSTYYGTSYWKVHAVIPCTIIGP